MKKRPMLYTPEMVRALLNDSKNRTRRLCKVRTRAQFDRLAYAIMEDMNGADDGTHERKLWEELGCPYGKPGDRLWVRENLYRSECGFWGQYSADNAWVVSRPPAVPLRIFWNSRRDACLARKQSKRFIPSIHMPRIACRIELEITNVRLERVQDITDADAELEGVDFLRHHPDADESLTAKELFKILWDVINGEESWLENRFVWVIEFKRVPLEGAKA